MAERLPTDTRPPEPLSGSGLDAQGMCEKLLEEIQLEAGGAEFEDDVCLLAVERRAPGEDAQPGA